MFRFMLVAATLLVCSVSFGAVELSNFRYRGSTLLFDATVTSSNVAVFVDVTCDEMFPTINVTTSQSGIGTAHMRTVSCSVKLLRAGTVYVRYQKQNGERVCLRVSEGRQCCRYYIDLPSHVSRHPTYIVFNGLLWRID
jgi:hypothetical protein